MSKAMQPNAKRVVAYLDAIIEINQGRINSGELVPVDYRANCKINASLKSLRDKVIEELSKDEDND